MCVSLSFFQMRIVLLRFFHDALYLGTLLPRARLRASVVEDPDPSHLRDPHPAVRLDHGRSRRHLGHVFRRLWQVRSYRQEVMWAKRENSNSELGKRETENLSFFCALYIMVLFSVFSYLLGRFSLFCSLSLSPLFPSICNFFCPFPSSPFFSSHSTLDILKGCYSIFDSTPFTGHSLFFLFYSSTFIV
jgi:hypothetical protein